MGPFTIVFVSTDWQPLGLELWKMSLYNKMAA